MERSAWAWSALVLFQLADASVLPLVGEDLAEGTKRGGSLWVSGLIIVPQIVVAILSPWVGYYSEKKGRKPLLLIGFALEPIRAALLAFTSKYFLLVVAEILDGFSSAIINVLTVLVITDLTAGTGRFNLARGFIGAMLGPPPRSARSAPAICFKDSARSPASRHQRRRWSGRGADGSTHRRDQTGEVRGLAGACHVLRGPAFSSGGRGGVGSITMKVHGLGARRRVPLIATLLAASLPVLIAAGAAVGQAPAPLAGKNVNLIIGFGPGGGYDIWGRLVAGHIGQHLPGNPAVVAQNMPGGGSYRAASYIYNQAPKDGSTFAIIARDAALGPLTGQAGALFDATKFSWIGTPATETNICIAYHTAPVQTAQDLLHNELIVGDTGPGTGTHSYPKALNAILGTKFKLVGGYPSSADVFLAMERGEVQGICESLDSVKSRRPDWISSGTVKVLFQGGAKPNPELQGVPFVVDLAQRPEDKQAIEFLYLGQGIGRPFVAPPGLPPDRLKMLRDAFDATMKDPAFIAEAKLRKFDLSAEDGAHLQALIDKAYATPRAIIERIAKLIQ